MKTKWIKSSDRLPDFNVGVLCFIPEEDGHITTGMWDVSRKWVLLDEYRIPKSEVTYWSEMVEKPKDQSYTKQDRSEEDILMSGQIRNLQKENFDLKTAIRKFVWHWESYFSNKTVGNPPDLQDLREFIE